MKTWHKYALGAAVLMFLVARGGFAMLAAGMRFLLPAAVIYFGYQLVKKAMLPSGEANRGTPPPGNEPPMIEICAACGCEKKTGHRCEA